MDQKRGNAKARQLGTCLRKPDGGLTCNRQLRKGRCPVHGKDVYDPIKPDAG